MAKGAQLVLWNGSRWDLLPVTSTADGTLKYGKGQELAMDVCELAGPGVYVAATEAIRLAEETQFHRARRRVALSSLFSPAGDIVELIRWVGWALIVLLAFWSATTVGGMSSSLQAQNARLSGQVQAIQSTLSKPINVEVPKGTQVIPPPGGTTGG